MLNDETKRHLDETRKYIKKWYDHNDQLDELIANYEEKKVNFFTYVSRKKYYTKETVKSEILIDIIEKLEKFSVTRLAISNNTVRSINNFLPLISSKDQEEIIKIFEEKEKKALEEDKKALNEIKSQSKLMEENLTNPLFRFFITAINEQERILNNHSYNSFDFKIQTKTSDEEYISEHNIMILKNIKKLINEKKLQNKNIERNIIQITKAYSRIGKLKYINSKINEVIESNGSDIEELKIILEKIKAKNERRIEKLETDLEKFNLEEVCKAATILDEEKKKDELEKERLIIFEDLTYELMKAKGAGYSDEIIEGLQNRLNDLDFYISDNEKKEIENRVKKRLVDEEDEKLRRIYRYIEKESKTSDENSAKKM